MEAGRECDPKLSAQPIQSIEFLLLFPSHYTLQLAQRTPYGADKEEKGTHR